MISGTFSSAIITLVVVNTGISLIGVDGVTTKSNATWVTVTNLKRIGIAQADVGTLGVVTDLVGAAVGVATGGFFAFVDIDTSLWSAISNLINFSSHLFVAVALVATVTHTVVTPLGGGVWNTFGLGVAIVCTICTCAIRIAAVKWISAKISAVGIVTDLSRCTWIHAAGAFVDVHATLG